MEQKILIVEDEFIVADHIRRVLIKAGHQVCGTASSYEEAVEIIRLDRPTWVLLDIKLAGDATGIDLASYLMKFEIPFIYLSANMNQKMLEEVKLTKPYGFLSKPFKDKELMMMLDIAMERHTKILELRLLGNQLPSDNDQDAGPNGMQTKLTRFANLINTHVPFDLACVVADKGGKILKDDMYIVREGLGYEIIYSSEVSKQISVADHEYKNLRKMYNHERESSYYVGLAFKRLRMDWPLLKHISSGFGMESMLSYIFKGSQMHPNIFLFRKNESDFGDKEITLQEQIGEILKKTFSEPQMTEITRDTKIVPIKKTIPQTMDDSKSLDGIIGKSASLLAILHQLKIVARTSTAVLITGESGTGKERIAQALHKLSPRSEKPFVIVNCAALPSTLIESELFGHEKGAFTGAGERRIGKFELADEGTIFLDEIGELPMESQVKLLRVLQEHQIERVGGNQLKNVNVRVVAATNRNMEKEVAEGRFRLDLYYRLNVFPLNLPPLRERKEDIPDLVNHFVDKCAEMIGIGSISVSNLAMNQLIAYDWPGNIRELSHVIERTVLLAENGKIREIMFPKHMNHMLESAADDGYIKTFDENERDHILSVLQRSFGRVAGEGGAAELLRVPATTLTSKIKRLGIQRKHISPDEQ